MHRFTWKCWTWCLRALLSLSLSNFCREKVIENSLVSSLHRRKAKAKEKFYIYNRAGEPIDVFYGPHHAHTWQIRPFLVNKSLRLRIEWHDIKARVYMGFVPLFFMVFFPNFSCDPVFSFILFYISPIYLLLTSKVCKWL